MNIQQEEINKKILGHFFFNPTPENLNINRNFTAPEDTINSKKVHLNSSKTMNNSMDLTVEDKIRSTKTSLNMDSELYSLSKSLAKSQQEEYTAFSAINKQNAQTLVKVDEKLYFNNHTRLYNN
tara:strand:+ start:204 stop:575 length:372 start_codon:yes stop_codon:yes gene_type:complete